MKNHIKNYLISASVDFLLLNAAIITMHIMKQRTIEASPLYFKLFLIFYLVWLGVSVITKKFNGIKGKLFYDGLALIVKSNIFIVYLIAFSVVGFHMIALSRIQTFGTCFLFFLLEVAAFSVCYQVSGKKTDGIRIERSKPFATPVNRSYQLIVIDGLLVMISFMVMNYFKRASFSIPEMYEQVILIIYGLWLPTSIITKKCDRNNFTDFYNAYTPCVKAFLIMSATLAVMIFAFRLFYFSRLQVFGTLVIMLGFEMVVYYLYYAYRKFGKVTGDIESIEKVKEKIQSQAEKRSLEHEDIRGPVDNPVDEKLKNALEFFSPKLYDFIGRNINLKLVNRDETALLSTDELINVRILDSNQHKLIVNLTKLNDVRWFNQYFLEAYSKLKVGGYLIGQVHTIRTHRQYYLGKYHRYIVDIFYAINFIWCRVFPKLPFLQKIYFALTRGKNRMVSRAEVFGRLYFCGFEVIADKEMENRLYYIAQKAKTPSTNKNPSYGPIVKLKRYSQNGDFILVYKFRTMHPYSEFLQDYVFENSNLAKGGKFHNDFRVTTWGRFMRKTWLDELPMLYNWLKGDVKFLGVRPLSEQYFNLYTDELKALRKKVKPGLVPPFYADLPGTLDEIIESETRYIKSYLKAPFRTQISYFWKSCVNIVFRRARSR